MNLPFSQMRLRTALSQLKADLRSDTERGALVRAAGINGGIKIAASLLAFASSLFYARALGPHDYGLYAYVITWTSVLAIPASLGIPRYLIREGARQVASLRWLGRWADARVLPAGIAAAGLLACAALIPAAAGARWLFVIAAPLPLLANLGGIRSALLQAMGLIARSQWPGLILSPMLVLCSMIGLWYWRGQLSALDLIILMVIASLVIASINEIQLRRAPGFSESNEPGLAQIRRTLPFMWLSMLYLVNTRADLIMLGALKGADSAGVYAVTTRAADFVAFFFVTSNIVITPRIARLYEQGNLVLLQRLITGATSRIFYLTLPIVLLFLFFAQPLMSYLYGTGFSAGSVALQILALAQLFNVLAGPTGIILNMTGHENITASAGVISAGINIVLNAVLIPYLDFTGAAIATGISMVIWNLFLWYWVRRHLDLRPSAFGY